MSPLLPGVNLSLVDAIRSPPDEKSKKCIFDFFLTLIICNSVFLLEKESRNNEGLSRENKGSSREHEGLMRETGEREQEESTKGQMEYQGESPDELALVKEARRYGFVLLERNSKFVEVSVLGEIQRSTEKSTPLKSPNFFFFFFNLGKGKDI